MIVKFLLNFWPVLLPIMSYVIHILLQKISNNKSYIKGEFSDGEEVDSYKNGRKELYFIVAIYSSMILAVVSFVFFALY